MENTRIKEDEKIEVCRLCLDLIIYEDVYLLDSVGMNVLEDIIPNLDLNISQDPKICHTCNKNMLTCYEFKSICDREIIKTEVKLEENMGSCMELKANEKKCDFCLNSINGKVHIGASKQFSKENLQKHLPKWILNRSTNVLSCEDCLETLKNQYTFLNGCLTTEEKIKKYCLATSTHEKVNLYNVLHHVLSSENETLNYKAPINNFSNGMPDNCVYKKADGDEYFLIKTENIEIKSEEVPEEMLTETVYTEQVEKLEEGEDSRESQKEHILKSNEVFGFYKTSCFKACLVPTCVNNTLITSDKIFLTVPIDYRREGWCTAIEQGIGEKLYWQENSNYYVCEDHFNLEKDMENYIYPYKMIGGRIFLKAGVVPHVFKCLYTKKRKNALLEESNKEPKQPKIENLSESNVPGKRSIGIQVNLDLLGKISVGTQVDLAVETRTIGVEAKPDVNNAYASCSANVSHATTSTTQFVIFKEKHILSKRKSHKIRK